MLDKLQAAFSTLVSLLTNLRLRPTAERYADDQVEYETVPTSDQLPCRVKLSLIRQAICAQISNALLYLRYGKEIFKDTNKKD